MKKSKLEAYLDFIAQVHKVKSEKKDVKKPQRNSVNKKIRFIALLLISMSTLVEAAVISIKRYPDPQLRKKRTTAVTGHSATQTGTMNFFRIELVSFSATLNDKIVDVEWLIQKDVQNTSFTIERSIDDDTYYPIGSVESIGNYDKERIYSFKDNSPLDGVSYYRLLQTDNNGQVKRYASTVINNKNNKQISVYPNPSPSGKVYLSGINNKLDNKVTVRDITGKIVPSKFSLEENDIYELTIDDEISSRKGIFIITIDDGKQAIQRKLIIK